MKNTAFFYLVPSYYQ